MIQKSQLIASFNGITDLILILNTDYAIVFTNKAFCDFYNIENSREIIGCKCYEIIHNDINPCHECPCQKTLETGSVVTVEKKIRGEIIYDDEEILEIIFPDGLPLHLINIEITTARYYSPSTKNFYERIYFRNKISIEYRFLIQELTKSLLRKGCKICLDSRVTEIQKIEDAF